ncbi:MAG: hypothetical protein PHT58_01840 [Eubacteriales bacterium]|nr:hypothetical protein [Eubacteriales bacterium]
MPYTVKSSEKLRKSGAEAETKALLYLMNFRNDSDQIHYFVVDFFNDLTGMDRFTTTLWDLQSKANSNNYPKSLGRELVTLFKNYLSQIDFSKYILFVGGVSDNFRIDSSQNTFGIGNVTAKSIASLRTGLIAEADEKEYIEKSSITDENVDDFLKKVLFVIDDKQPREYVKAIIKNHPTIIPEDKILDAIFNEIRDIQASKKNISNVEGITIQTVDEALNYYRHLTTNEIRLLTLQRIINRDPVEQGVPLSFFPLLYACPPERQKDLVDECQRTLCRALFNKNAAESFWSIFESVYNAIITSPNDDVKCIYSNLDRRLCASSPDFDVQSLKYFISVVKDGVQN